MAALERGDNSRRKRRPFAASYSSNRANERIAFVQAIIHATV